MDQNNHLSISNFCLQFTEAYLSLYQRGLITDEQFEKIVGLLDMMEVLPPELFKERLNRIFSENK